MQKKVASLIYGENLHFLDHLAPLCYFLDIFLITNSEKIFELTKKYYPKVKVQYIESLKINFYVVKNFDKIITCITKEFFDNEFRFHQDVLKKEIDVIWCPHGNSDKGKTIFYFEALKNANNVLIYGKKMIDFLKEKKVFSTIKNPFIIGNYRLKYFQEFEKFFKKIIKNEILKNLCQNNLHILYAPTWQDKENSSTFFKVAKKLFNQLPDNFNLIVQLHPNLIDQNHLPIQTLKNKYQKNNIFFLDDFTLIYPLLNFVDLYLGDFSSIGYDFLAFNKPALYFKAQNKKLSSDLFKSAKLIKDEKNIIKEIQNALKNDHIYNDQRKKLYSYTFKECKNKHFKDLKKLIFN